MPYLLFFNRQRYTTPGETVDVPDELATEWVNSGWADKPEKAPEKAAETAPRTRKGS